MKRVMAAAALLILMSAAAQSGPVPATPGDNDDASGTLTLPVDNPSAWDVNHTGNGSDKSETLGSPYYNIR